MAEAGARAVYLLRGRDLSPETIAVAFAKTSRSPLSFRQIAAELSDEQSAEFHEKWVVGYGHASVAEHAVLHVAFENVSRLAVEAIESRRLASYTEKSTRYQRWEPGGYHTPPEIAGTARAADYRALCDLLFEAYRESLDPVRALIAPEAPRREGESEARWDGRIRSRYVDVCRFLLPAAALANLGMTANARTLEHAVRRLRAHPLAEVRAIGDELWQAAVAEVPTLLKYAEPTPYMAEAPQALAQAVGAAGVGRPGAAARLIAWDPDGEARVLAAALYEQSGGSFDDLFESVRAAGEAGRAALAQAALGGRGRFDAPLRALEHTAYTFDVVVDQGAYFELKRHRMMTQTPQRLTTDLGYAVPRRIVEAGFESRYRQAMQAAAEGYRTLAAWNPEAAAYVVPNAFNRRVLLTLNLREAFQLCELRAAANAHVSIRRLALQMAERIREVHPLLSQFLRLPEESWQALEAEAFAQV